jgi:hypothetical protein
MQEWGNTEEFKVSVDRFSTSKPMIFGMLESSIKCRKCGNRGGDSKVSPYM